LSAADQFDRKEGRHLVRLEVLGKVHPMKKMLIVTSAAFGLMATLILVRAEDVSKENYLARCASCHGAGGHGDGPSIRWLRTKPTDFHNCDAMKKLSDNNIFKAIKYGTGMIDLPADMPAFGDRFSDGEIDGLGSYVRRFCASGTSEH
jgi:mono/diheme cytochrome c family protein